MRIIVICVIYNEKIIGTKVFETLVKSGAARAKLNAVFVDNSTDNDIKQCNCKFKYPNCEYIDMKGNRGLAVAYNTAVSMLELKNDDWIMISDQDTSFFEDYVDVALNEINKHEKYSIFAPIVWGEKLVSPCVERGLRYWCIEFDDFNKVDKRYQFYINSGLCISAKVFNAGIKYDENLFLDFVDYDFIQQIHKVDDVRCYVSNKMRTLQNFSGQLDNSFNADYKRYKIYVKDGKYYYKKWYKKSVFKYRIIFARGIKLAFKHHSGVFVKEMVEKNN